MQQSLAGVALPYPDQLRAQQALLVASEQSQCGGDAAVVGRRGQAAVRVVAALHVWLQAARRADVMPTCCSSGCNC